MRAFGKLVPAVLILAALALLPACVAAAVAAGVAGIAYVNGDLEATLGATPQKVIEASQAVLKEMDVPIVSKDASAIDGKVIGRTSQRKIEITVQRETDTTSKISIRIDTFGDERLSRQILEKIQAKL
jgi:hypothetical protein